MIGVGAHVGGTHALDQALEGDVARGVGAQHQRVDEAADEVVEHVVGATRDRGADGDVFARTHAAEQRGERGLQHHEHAGLGFASELGQALMQGLRQADRHAVARVAGHGGHGEVEGQVELIGCAGQRALPVVDLLADRAVGALGVAFVAEQLLLPQGEVDVLHGQRRQL